MTLLVLAEGCSRRDIPVVMADVKGDVAGLAMPGPASDSVQEPASWDAASSASSAGVNIASPVVIGILHTRCFTGE